jgi:hypothetical protein
VSFFVQEALTWPENRSRVRPMGQDSRWTIPEDVLDALLSKVIFQWDPNSEDAEAFRHIWRQPFEDALQNVLRPAELTDQLRDALEQWEPVALALLRRHPVRNLDELIAHTRLALARYHQGETHDPDS